MCSSQNLRNQQSIKRNKERKEFEIQNRNKGIQEKWGIGLKNYRFKTEERTRKLREWK